MKRWGIAGVVVFLLCIPLLLVRASTQGLLEDTDTRVLLEAIDRRSNPWSWFAGDWPLENHFYRPVSTLFFEFDRALFGSDATGYGWTNFLLAVACVAALFWLVAELSRSPLIAAATSGLLALWLSKPAWIDSTEGLWWLIGFGALVGSFGGKRSPKRGLVAFGLCAFVAVIVGGPTDDLPFFIVQWLPGRTASTFTLFALASMACYARFERLTTSKPLPLATPFDVPATRSAPPPREPVPYDRVWLGLSVVACLMAFGCYEQAVMLPAALLGVAVSLKLQGYRVRWSCAALFWALLVGYLALRSSVLPSGVSRYQDQQFRDGAGVIYSLLAYLIPCARVALEGISTLQLGASALFVATPYTSAIATLGNFFAAGKLWSGNVRLPRDQTAILALTGLALGFIAFLPMAWLKHFGHYHLWPMALHAMFVVAMAVLALKAVVSAWSPRAIQAPQRLSPAPGSLPRP